MPPSLNLSDLWGGGGGSKGETGTPVVVRLEKPATWSMAELKQTSNGDGNNGNESSAVPNKERRGRNARQLTWVLLLRAHRAAGGLAWFANGLWSLLRVIRKRLILRQGVAMEAEKTHKEKLFKFLRAFLYLCMAALIFETLAYLQGWQHFYYTPQLRFSMPGDAADSFGDLLEWIYLSWVSFRSAYIAPPIQTLSDICILLFLIQSIDRIVLCVGCFWIRYKKIKPRLPEQESFSSSSPDVEQGDSAAEAEFPMVLVQIPMCNEKEVYEQSISAVCQLDWPKDRLLVQVLDDSDDEEVQQLIRGEVLKWSQKGINIVYRHRLIRTGYKAGNLKSAMSCDYVKDYEFVAIFDADFQPKPDFLKLTVPHFKDQPELGLVQARWAFVNKDENLLTRLQNINLSFHFEVEQQVNGVFLNFFGFNGTAGVWRIKALEESGGWLERTTVEDMDIAVRAHLNGWKFIFLNDVRVLCEVPESYEAYRKQQHRWHSGPMQLFRLCLPDIISSKISLRKKANLIFLFFLLRKLILPFYSFTLFCIILPMTMFVPEAQLPIWVICYIPAVMSILNVLPAPSSFPFIIPYLLFENTMSVTKFNAMISGLFQLGSAYEWVVTKKTGRSSETDLLAVAERESKNMNQPLHRRASESGLDMLNNKLSKQSSSRGPSKKINRLYRKELALAFLLLTAAARSLLSAQGIHFYFLLFQGLSFLLVGLDLIGEQVS